MIISKKKKFKDISNLNIKLILPGSGLDLLRRNWQIILTSTCHKEIFFMNIKMSNWLTARLCLKQVI